MRKSYIVKGIPWTAEMGLELLIGRKMFVDVEALSLIYTSLGIGYDEDLEEIKVHQTANVFGKLNSVHDSCCTVKFGSKVYGLFIKVVIPYNIWKESL